MSQPIPLYCGFDQREAMGFHVFAQSVLERSSVPVAFIPLHGPMLKDFDGQKDGTNAFIYSRFLVPMLQKYEGWAVFADAADMVCLDDINELWSMRDDRYAVMVAPHDYKTKHPRKYIGTPMETGNADYPGKNRSSLILFNCGHPANRRLTTELVAESPGSFLHRFQWLSDDLVGSIPLEWNALACEQNLAGASLIHFTLGSPGFNYYKGCDGADHWHRAHKNATHMVGE